MNQKAPGSTVERMVRNGLNRLNIEVETDWTIAAIDELAAEIGFEYDICTGRFRQSSMVGCAETPAMADHDGVIDMGFMSLPAEVQHAASSPRPAAPETDTGATDEGPPSREQTHSAVAPVSLDDCTCPDDDVSVIDTCVIHGTKDRDVTILSTDALLAAGLNHIDDRIRGLATHARDTIATLATALVEWEQRGEALAEVARLEEELAAARVRAGLADVPTAKSRTAWMTPKNPHAKRPVGVSFADLKRFSDEHGLGWSGRGRPTNALIDAYRDAAEEASA